MISVSGGTKTWSDAPQQTDFKSDGRKQISASESQDQFGGQDVGAVLNKLSDPNWVDPSKKLRAVGNNELGKDAFLNLLLTQMKNQDPTNPLKSHEMAAQLAQFTSLEKLTNIDEGIGELKKVQTPEKNFAALSLIGKTISGDGAKIIRSNQESGHDIRFSLANDATTAELNILNEDGELVRTLQANGLKSGDNEVYWDGSLEDGTKARVGEYQVEVVARGSNGHKVIAESKFEGKVTGVNFTATGPVLLVGEQKIPMKDVNRIVEESKSNATRLEPQAASVEQKTEAGNKTPGVTVPESKERKAVSGENNLEKVAMARGMINQLNKQGAETGM